MDELYELVCGCEACVKPSKKLEPKLSTVSFGSQTANYSPAYPYL